MNSIFEQQRCAYLSRVPQLLSENYRQPWSTCMRYGAQDAHKISELCNRAASNMTSALSSAAGKLAEGKSLDNICMTELLPYYRKQSFPDTAAGGTASAISDMMVLIVSAHPDQFAQYAGGQIHQDVVSHLNGTLHAWLLDFHKQWKNIRSEIGADQTIFEVSIPPPTKEKATLGTMFSALGECLCIGPPRPSPYIDEAAQSFAERFNVRLWPTSGATEKPTQDFKCAAEELSAQFQEWYFTVGKANIRLHTFKETRSAEDAFVKTRDILHQGARKCGTSAHDAKCVGKCMSEFYDRTAREDEKFSQIYRATIRAMHRRLLQ